MSSANSAAVPVDAQARKRKLDEVSAPPSSANGAQYSHSATHLGRDGAHTPPPPLMVGGREWTLQSWRSLPIKQQPTYDDADELQRALDKVRRLPPLVHPKEVAALQEHLAGAIRGEKFLLQGGDCAERFLDCAKEPIESKFKILLQMSLILVAEASMPVIRLARMAGQFAKPRSSATEVVDGQEVFSFKGDNINGFAADQRRPDPRRLVDAYFHSASTLNYVRAMISGGVSDLRAAPTWNLMHVRDSTLRQEYERVISRILSSFQFLHTIHADESDSLRGVEMFTSHEGLLLCYEEALTKYVTSGVTTPGYYNLGAHFLWIGERTRQLDNAHVEYFRGISNPLGCKIGPSMAPGELAQLVQHLNPNRIPGHLTLITRYGYDKVESVLAKHIQAVKETGVPVLWICDPCHGNTEISPSGLKTRNLTKVLDELMRSFDIHRQEGSHLGGVHLELTGEDVTECVGGSSELEHHSLPSNYETYCDPRLNYTQSLDMAFAIARKISEQNRVRLTGPHHHESHH
jgi:3-deoxy-7-phosphoheptulonate synthase